MGFPLKKHIQVFVGAKRMILGLSSLIMIWLFEQTFNQPYDGLCMLYKCPTDSKSTMAPVMTWRVNYSSALH